MRRVARVAMAIATALGFAPVAHADMKALEEAAKKEGEITWYTSHYTSEGAEDLGRGFTEMYGIKANVVRMTAQVAYQRLLHDLKKNQIICDVFSSTDVGHYVRLAAEDRLEKYAPQTESKIAPMFRNFDSTGYYHTTSAGLVVLTYNSAKVKAEEAPKKWPDLLDIKWKGKVSLGHPGFSGYVGTWALTLRNLYGGSFFEKAREEQAADRPLDKRHGDRLERRRATGGGGLGRLDPFSASRGNPLAVNYPSDGAVLIIAPSAIMKGAKHPNAARLFMEYLYSFEAAKINARHFAIPLRPEVPSPPGAKPISEIKTIRPTVAEIDKGIAEVIEQWRETFGN